MRLLAETTRIEHAGREIGKLSRDLQVTVRSASGVLTRVESEVGDSALGSALQHLGHCLARAEQQSVRAIGAFGEQVAIAAAGYRETDLDLARAFHGEPR